MGASRSSVYRFCVEPFSAKLRCVAEHAVISRPYSASAPTLRMIGDEAGFVALAPQWDELVRAMPRPSPFLLHGWALEWWRAYGANARLAIQVAERDDRLVAALPFVVVSRLGVRRLRFLGGDQSALADALLAQDENASVLGALLDRTRAGGGYDFLDVFGLPADSRLARALGPGDAHLIERVEAPVLDLTDGWKAVAARKLSGTRRRDTRRRRRRLEELGRFECDVVSTPEQLDPVFTEVLEVHRLRWEGRPDTSDLGTETGARFQRAALLALAAGDVSRIATARLDGRLIGFAYYYSLGSTMSIHRIGFDPAYHAYSPGLLCREAAFEAATQEGLTRVEHLGGGETHKLELTDGFEPLHQGLGLPGTLRGRVLLYGRLGAILLRRRLKRSEALRRVWIDGLAPLRRARDRLRSGRGG